MSAPLRILLVEDNPDDRLLAVRDLRREFPGLQVEQVGEPTGLTRALEGASFDLVITDYYLGWTTGLAVLRAVKARWPDCPVIMFTGTGSEEIAVEAMKAGLDDYILKSLRVRLPAAVLAVVERVEAHRREARLEAASRHKSAFLANMSHELRTPLNSILGFSELMQQQTYGSLTAKQARYLGHIHQSGQHLLALINDLLDLSKVEAGKLDLRPVPFSLPEALDAAITEIGPQAQAKQQHIQLHVAEEISTLTADPLRFKQILLNLLSNAVKFTPDGGSVTVTAKRGSRGEGPGSSDASPLNPKPSTLYPGDFIEIAVADTGIGIEPEEMSKLFQPFTQLEDTFIKQHQGTGLGLTLTKRLVELHGGQILAESSGKGQGSTFTVQLPLARCAGQEV